MTIKWYKSKTLNLIDNYIVFQEYSVQLTFRQDWLDPRLSYSNHNGKLLNKTSLKVTILFHGRIIN